MKKKMEEIINRLKRTIFNNRVSFFVGLLIGILFTLILCKYIAKDNKNITLFALLIGAFFTVIIERIIDYSKIFVLEFINSHPFRILLGSLSREKIFICISPYLRDMTNLEQSKLFRFDRNRKLLPEIVGTPYLIGTGDATALTFLYSALYKLNNQEIELIEDHEIIEKWNRSIICIGAHNSKTREILSKYENTYFTFINNYTGIIKLPIKEFKDSIYKAVFQKKGEDSSIIDYGIIIKLVDIYHQQKKTIFIIAGIGDAGTAGAAYFFKNHYKELPIDLDEFGVLIQVPSGIESAKMVDFNQVADFLKTRN